MADQKNQQKKYIYYSQIYIYINDYHFAHQYINKYTFSLQNNKGHTNTHNAN